MKWQVKCISILGMLLIHQHLMAAVWEITYPRASSQFDQRNKYPVAVLELALKQTGVKYRLNPSNLPLNQGKAIHRLQQNREVNVLWSMTDNEREEALRPIRIPIFKGLIGWRIFLVKQNQLVRLNKVDSLQALLKLHAVQGYDWPDTKVLQSNGFEVTTAKQYAQLFDLLASEQADFFPRSVLEIWDELEHVKSDENLAAEPKMGLIYPTAMYFFVNKQNVNLARLIEDGLEKAIKNGKFDALFIQSHAQLIKQANINSRTFFPLKNELLPAATPLKRKELWFKP